MSGSECRVLILKVLRQHPEGLTLTSISKMTGLHRHTITKYVYELRGAEAIVERDIGPAKLCYLSEDLTPTREKKIVSRLGNGMRGSAGQIQVLAVMMFFLLVPASVIVAQNATNLTHNFTVTGAFTSLLENMTNTSNESANATFNGSVPVIIPDTNQSIPENPPEDIEENLPWTNQTAGTNNSMDIPQTNETSPKEGPILDAEIISENRLFRGNEATITARVTNAGDAEAPGVSVHWILPEGLKIIEGGETTTCQTIEAGGKCESTIKVLVSESADIGLADLKIEVRYP